MSSFSPRSDKPRCAVCQRKLSLIEQTTGICKCKQVFCAKHRCIRPAAANSENPAAATGNAAAVAAVNPAITKPCHTCSFDYVAERQELLRQQNPTIKIDKVQMI
jgi:hypothetical protein